MKNGCRAILFVAVLVAAGCGPFCGISELKDATGFFAALLCENQIPDVRKEDHGEFYAAFDPPGFRSGYPMTVNASLTLKGQQQARVYVIKKETPSSPWLITRAWTKDENGNTVELPIPTSNDQLKANEKLTQPPQD